ncbi:hypothetical protein HK098_005826 [Nowakowskiella sp. JEL0407]|nr:hypothetical protein HK098_005826 [Nowakowskiella sp. JEL0407]
MANKDSGRCDICSFSSLGSFTDQKYSNLNNNSSTKQPINTNSADDNFSLKLLEKRCIVQALSNLDKLLILSPKEKKLEKIPKFQLNNSLKFLPPPTFDHTTVESSMHYKCLCTLFSVLQVTERFPELYLLAQKISEQPFTLTSADVKTIMKSLYSHRKDLTDANLKMILLVSSIVCEWITRDVEYLKQLDDLSRIRCLSRVNWAKGYASLVLGKKEIAKSCFGYENGREALGDILALNINDLILEMQMNTTQFNHELYVRKGQNTFKKLLVVESINISENKLRSVFPHALKVTEMMFQIDLSSGVRDPVTRSIASLRKLLKLYSEFERLENLAPSAPTPLQTSIDHLLSKLLTLKTNLDDYFQPPTNYIADIISIYDTALCISEFTRTIIANCDLNILDLVAAYSEFNRQLFLHDDGMNRVRFRSLGLENQVFACWSLIKYGMREEDTDLEFVRLASEKLSNVDDVLNGNETLEFDVETLRLQAFMNFNLGEFDSALKDLQQLLKNEFDESEIKLTSNSIGCCYYQMGQPLMAAKYFEQLVHDDPENAVWLFNLSVCHLATKNKTSEVEILKRLHDFVKVLRKNVNVGYIPFSAVLLRYSRLLLSEDKLKPQSHEFHSSLAELLPLITDINHKTEFPTPVPIYLTSILSKQMLKESKRETLQKDGCSDWIFELRLNSISAAIAVKEFKVAVRISSELLRLIPVGSLKTVPDHGIRLLLSYVESVVGSIDGTSGDEENESRARDALEKLEILGREFLNDAGNPDYVEFENVMAVDVKGKRKVGSDDRGLSKRIRLDISRVTHLNEYEIKYYNFRARVFFILGNLENAICELKKVEKLQPLDLEMTIKLSDLYFMVGEPKLGTITYLSLIGSVNSESYLSSIAKPKYLTTSQIQETFKMRQSGGKPPKVIFEDALSIVESVTFDIVQLLKSTGCEFKLEPFRTHVPFQNNELQSREGDLVCKILKWLCAIAN